MEWTWLQVHAACIVLLIGDLLARTLRIRVYVAAVHSPLKFSDAFVLTAFGDSAAALTPLRSGGNAARLGGLHQAGVPLGRSIAVLAADTVVHQVLLAATAAGLAWAVAPEWWRDVGATVEAIPRNLLWWAGAALLLAGGVLMLLRRWRLRPGAAALSARYALTGLRSHPLRVILLGSLLTLVSIASRVAILPVIALALPERPSLSALIMGSFLLVYGQLFVPTPAGLGAVEIGLAGGIAGSFGPDTARVIFDWRLYTTIVPVVLGLVLALGWYGPALIRRSLRLAARDDLGQAP